MLIRRTKNKVRRRQAALQLLSGQPPGRVLDAPCGDGALAGELAARGWRTWAGDIEPAVFDHRGGVRFVGRNVILRGIKRGSCRSEASMGLSRHFGT